MDDWMYDQAMEDMMPGGRSFEEDSCDPEDHEIECEEIIRETDKSWLLRTLSGAESWWPKSQCHLDEATNTLYVPDWLYRKKSASGESFDHLTKKN